jgi:DNA-binding ferritin-like protein
MAIRMQQRRGTAEQWDLANPILAAGEIGFETDTNQFKLGDGVNRWEDLAYFVNADGLGGSLDDYIPLEEKGIALGVATLDESGQVPADQLGNATVDLSGLATEDYVDTAIENVVGLAPETLDTLAELATALGDDPAAITTLQSDVSALQTGKADLVDGQVPANQLANATVDLSGYATEGYVDTAIENVVGLAPETLDTLAELATALGDDPNAITNLQNNKADTNSPTFTGLTDFEGIVDFSEAVVIGIEAGSSQSSVPHPFSMIG